LEKNIYGNIIYYISGINNYMFTIYNGNLKIKED